MESLRELQVYQSPYPKIRIGNPTQDGGYVVCDLPGSYDGFYSCGVGSECSFEEGLLKKYPNIPFCIAYDGTISTFPHTTAPIQFVQKNLAAFPSDTTTNLHEELAAAHNLFVKMDIEKYEFRVIPTWEPYMKNIKQFVLEIHTYVDYTMDITYNLLHLINQTHTMIHLHANNAGGTRTEYNVTVPGIFECTFVRNDFIPQRIPNTDPIPSSIDCPNVQYRPDIILSGLPYTV